MKHTGKMQYICMYIKVLSTVALQSSPAHQFGSVLTQVLYQNPQHGVAANEETQAVWELELSSKISLKSEKAYGVSASHHLSNQR